MRLKTKSTYLMRLAPQFNPILCVLELFLFSFLLCKYEFFVKTSKLCASELKTRPSRLANATQVKSTEKPDERW